MLMAFITLSAIPVVDESAFNFNDRTQRFVNEIETVLEEKAATGTDPQFLQEGAPLTRGNKEQVGAGGVWTEYFESKDDFENIKDLYISDTGVDLADDELLLFADNFSKDSIDAARWTVIEGDGTQMTSTENLVAIKSGSQQTSETYIESLRSWQVSRRLEFEWNSILEDGLGGYAHEIDVYRGITGERIWISIEGDMRVILKSSTGSNADGPPFLLIDNRWYRFSCKLTPVSASLKISDKNGEVLNYQNMSHDFSGKGSIRFNFAQVSNQKGNFEVRADNVSLYAGYRKTGEIITNDITIDNGHIWDQMRLEKIDFPPLTRIELDILDSKSNLPLNGYSNLTGVNIDISNINSTLISSLKLRARFFGDGLSTPSLNSIVLSWQPPRSFVDNFISDAKIAISSNVEFVGLSISLEPGFDEGYFITDTIQIPQYHYWNMLILDKFEPAENSYIGFTVIDELSGQPVENHINQFESEFSLKPLDPIRYSSIRIRIDFYGYSSKDPIIYSLSLNWSKNQAPKIIELQGPSAMYRGDTESFSIFLTDFDEPVDHLNVSFSYSMGAIYGGTIWESEFVKDLLFKNGLWLIEFSPPNDAQIGSYNFRVIVNDFFKIVDTAIWTSILEVQNRPPDAPEVILSPAKPYTNHGLKCFVVASSESNFDDNEIIYRWYKNGVLQPGLTADIVNSEYTAKYDTWRCEVVLFDGYDESQAGYSEVFIENSAPRAISGFVTIDIAEDGIGEAGVLLDNYFIDEDKDTLDYAILPTDNLDIEFNEKSSMIYITPERNWFGTVTAIIYASDDSADISKSFLINVEPLNDAPIISTVGSQVIRDGGKDELKFNTIEGETLKLYVSAEDIDGDDLIFSSNRTDGKGNDDLDGFSMDRNTGLISYKPAPDGIREFSVNISVSDNNGSKVHAELKITVYEKSESSFQQILFSTNWMVLIIVCIIMFSIYYSFVLGKARLKAYMRKKYREKLTGTGRLYANYPMVVKSTEGMEVGRYPAETGEYAALEDPYRAARYSHKHGVNDIKKE
jgi:hypothetical protein